MSAALRDIVAEVAANEGKDVLSRLLNASSAEEATVEMRKFTTAVSARAAPGSPASESKIQACMNQVDATRAALQHFSSLVNSSNNFSKSSQSLPVETELEELKKRYTILSRDRDKLFASFTEVSQSLQQHVVANNEYKKFEKNIGVEVDDFKYRLAQLTDERNRLLSERNTLNALQKEFTLQRDALTTRNVSLAAEATTMRESLNHTEMKYNDAVRQIEGMRNHIAGLNERLRTTTETADRRARRTLIMQAKIEELTKALEIAQRRDSSGTPQAFPAGGASITSSPAAGIAPRAPHPMASPSVMTPPPFVVTSFNSIGPPARPRLPSPPIVTANEENQESQPVPSVKKDPDAPDPNVSVPVTSNERAATSLEQLASTPPFQDMLKNAFEPVPGSPTGELICTFCRRRQADPHTTLTRYGPNVPILMEHCQQKHPKIYAYALNFVPQK